MKVKVPFNPEQCPIFAGMIIHNPNTNTDEVVLVRYLDGSSLYRDKLIQTASDTYTGNDLLNKRISYYVNTDTWADERAWSEVEVEVEQGDSDV